MLNNSYEDPIFHIDYTIDSTGPLKTLSVVTDRPSLRKQQATTGSSI